MDAPSLERATPRRRRRMPRSEECPMTARHRLQHEPQPMIPAMQREARRGVRFPSRQPRVVEWEDTEGRSHRAEGSTRIVGAFGCKLVLPHGLPLGQRITLSDPVRNTAVVGTVVWKGKERPEGCEMGVELITPNMDVWVREPQLPPSEERRRGQRAVLRVPVLLHYAPPNLATQVIPVHTLSVNDHGALVLSPRDFLVGCELELENRQAHKYIHCRVKRAPKETPEGFQIALEFDQPSIGFWPVSFPPPQ